MVQEVYLVDDQKLTAARKITLLVYILQAASFFVGITYLVAAVINYVKSEDVRGTWLESHFRWQLRTFWFSLLWVIVGGFSLLVGIGYLILVADTIWVIYRIVKGWLWLVDGKVMYSARAAGAS